MAEQATVIDFLSAQQHSKPLSVFQQSGRATRSSLRQGLGVGSSEATEYEEVTRPRGRR